MRRPIYRRDPRFGFPAPDATTPKPAKPREFRGRGTHTAPRNLSALNAIQAPYNFVPLADWVYFPAWSGAASHDLPFSDGIGGTLEFTSREAAARSPLAERLFDVPGVTSVFYGSDFVTVTKDGSDWQHLKPAILGAIIEHYMSGAPLLADGSVASDEAADEEDEFFNEADAETVATIKDLIETRVRPAVANDGGDITFRGFKDGIVYLNMKGACSGCPSSTATLQHGIQNLLKHFVPDVVEVRPV